MAVYNATPPKIRIAFLRTYAASSMEQILPALRIDDPTLASRIVLDYENPDYVIVANGVLVSRRECKKLRHYLSHNKESIFIFVGEECCDPDLNVFDYATVWNPDLQCSDRIVRNIPYIYSGRDKAPYSNDLTREEALKLLEGCPKFCNFLYSHPQEPRDTFFHLLSGYKRVDSLGRHMNNTGATSSTNYYRLSSTDMKKGYKFSMAMENATYRGYTSEKLITSLLAHTVPIYWGDPAVAELINPKAFINCHDYSSFDEVIERVREIDNNDDLWLDMVTSEWQTEEQRAKTLQIVQQRYKFTQNIFSQDIRAARRRPVGAWGDFSRKGFTGYVGVMPPLYLRAFRKLRRLIGKCLPPNLKLSIKKALDMD